MPQRMSTQVMEGSSSSRAGGSGQYRNQGLEPFQAPPQPVSFLFRIDHLSLQDNSIGVQEGIHWTPPQRSNEYDRQLGPLYRWTDGEVTVVQPNDRANTSALDPYECATVFTQYPDTHHFLAVAFDASSQNVSDEGGWYELGFDHHRQPANPDLVYSYFEIRGHRHHLATPRPAAWIQQLFPTQYHHPNQPGQMVPFTGLTGQLTLLLAIVAFSCPENSLDYVLQNCLRQGEWTPHELGDGRLTRRGMVVSVFLDPGGSDRQTLHDYELGTFGPYFWA